VGVNARLLRSPNLRGWNRYTLNLVDALAELGNNVYLYSDRPLDDGHVARLANRNCVVRVSEPMRYFFWEQQWLPRQCAADNVDVLHCPYHFGLPWSTSFPRVVTIHDAIDRAYYDPLSRSRKQWGRREFKATLYQWIARTRAHHVLTVSEHAKSGLIEYLGIPATKITVAHLAADPCFLEPMSEIEKLRAREAVGITQPYFLYVGGFERRKNVPFLVRAFADAQLGDTVLVLAGENDGYRDELLHFADSVGVQAKLLLPGGIKDSQLAALYAGALAFVYPSHYEGFGLQLCEAMAVGCPVLAARATSLPEVLGNGGETFDLSAPDELIALLRRIQVDSAFRDSLSARAKARSADFCWRRTAEQTVSAYRCALEAM
jgi:glycosyltransferase involved in cell wall biosynthesis